MPNVQQLIAEMNEVESIRDSFARIMMCRSLIERATDKQASIWLRQAIDHIISTKQRFREKPSSFTHMESVIEIGCRKVERVACYELCEVIKVLVRQNTQNLEPAMQRNIQDQAAESISRQLARIWNEMRFVASAQDLKENDARYVEWKIAWAKHLTQEDDDAEKRPRLEIEAHREKLRERAASEKWGQRATVARNKPRYYSPFVFTDANAVIGTLEIEVDNDFNDVFKISPSV